MGLLFGGGMRGRAGGERLYFEGMGFEPPSAAKVHQYILDDFETSWEALAARAGKKESGGANFLFALLSMIYLEFACRMCAKDDTGSRIARFSAALKSADCRYFTRLPGRVTVPHEFCLPFDPEVQPDSCLIQMIYDLIRNGKAHQYNSVIVQLPGGNVDLAITGAGTGRSMNRPNRKGSTTHLRYMAADGGIYLRFEPDQMFLDLKKAVIESDIVCPSERVDFISRPRLPSPGLKSRRSGQVYAFSLHAFKSALVCGGHSRFRNARLLSSPNG